MPTIGPHCHELRINDAGSLWRIAYRIHPLGVVILHVFDKDTRKTPAQVIRTCKTRLNKFLASIQ